MMNSTVDKHAVIDSFPPGRGEHRHFEEFMGAAGENNQLNRLARACGVIAAGFGIAALLGWILEFPLLANLGPRWIPMAPSSALLFVLFGTAVVLNARAPSGRSAYRAGMAIGSAGALLTLLLLVVSLLGIRHEAEHLGFTIAGTVDGAPTGHISPVTALCFMLAGLSLVASLSSSVDRRRADAGFWLGGLVILAGFVFSLPYLYDVPLLYGGRFIPPALTTSLALVALGGALCAVAAARARAPGNGIDAANLRASRFSVLLFALVVTGVAASSHVLFRNFEKQHRAKIERRLSAISAQKVSELGRWKAELLADAAFYRHNAAFAALARYFLAAPEDASHRQGLVDWISQTQKNRRYDVFLLDALGAVRLSIPDKIDPLSSIVKQQALEAARSRQVRFVDFYRDEHSSRTYLAQLIPLLDPQDDSRTLGVLVWRIDPRDALYPSIERWPVPSRTAETMLVRRDGDDVLFLSELRFRKEAPLTQRIPLTKTETPTVQAVLGHEGIFEGTDYRGARTIASARAVPDSPWFVVARVDAAEAFAPLRQLLWMTLGLAGTLLIAAGAAAGLFWRGRRLRHSKEQVRGAEALRESEATYHSLFDNMLNGIAYCRILFENGRPRDFVYLSVNHAFETQTGLKNVVGRKVTEVIPGIREADPGLFETYGRVAMTGQPEQFEIFVQALQLWFSISVYSPKREYFVAVFDVITERKRADQELRGYAERLQGLSRRLIAVEETERRNINRELHDRIGQKLAALNINLNIIRSQLPQESLRVVSARLQDTQTLLEETAAQIRNVMTDLHPPALDEYGLLAALRTYVESFGARVAVPITLHAEDLAPRLSLAAETALFRIAQEALANAAAHARAQRIQITLAATPDRVTLTIADDGVGFDAGHTMPAGNHWGLAIMRERAEAVGATLRIDTAPGRGTRVAVEIGREAA